MYPEKVTGIALNVMVKITTKGLHYGIIIVFPSSFVHDLELIATVAMSLSHIVAKSKWKMKLLGLCPKVVMNGEPPQRILKDKKAVYICKREGRRR